MARCHFTELSSIEYVARKYPPSTKDNSYVLRFVSVAKILEIFGGIPGSAP